MMFFNFIISTAAKCSEVYILNTQQFVIPGVEGRAHYQQ